MKTARLVKTIFRTPVQDLRLYQTNTETLYRRNGHDYVTTLLAVSAIRGEKRWETAVFPGNSTGIASWQDITVITNCASHADALGDLGYTITE